MSIGLKGFNFASIQSRLNAARELQEAGQDETAKIVLKSLCEDILKEIAPTNKSDIGNK